PYLAHDAIDLRREPHVEHAIRLVEDQNLEVVENDVLALEMIDQPPGRRHDHVHSGSQLLLLWLERNATVDGCDRHRSISRVLPEARFHLNTQFARRRENGHSRSARTAGKSLDDWERKGSSLSGSRLGRGHDVAALQIERNGLRLTGRRAGIAG